MLRQKWAKQLCRGLKAFYWPSRWEVMGRVRRDTPILDAEWSVSVPVLDDCQTPLRNTLRRRWWKSELKAVSLSDQRDHPHHSVNEWTPASNEFIIIKLRVGMGCWGINELLKDCFERAPNFMFVHWVPGPSMVYRIILSQGQYRPWRSPSPTHISLLMSSITSHQRSDLSNSKDKEDQSIWGQLWLFEKPLFMYSTNIY